LKDGDQIDIIIDRINLIGSINFVGELDNAMGPDWGDKELSKRPIPGDLSPHPKLPEDTRLWAALQSASGGTWGVCVFDVDDIVKTLEAG
jgi:hypothetical protein